MTRQLVLAASVGFALFAPAITRAADDPIDADVLLENATIHDGGGEEPVVGDVAIRGDKIVAVGKFATGFVGRTIDCRGLIVAPGFIDLHNHSDRQVVAPETRGVVNYLMQGCTTIVTGNCGSGPIDVGEFYDKIDAAGAGTNVAHLLPQGNLRSRVVGAAQRKATADELEEMQRLVHKAMEEGAWGMSTGLIYVPSSYADTDELIALARTIAAGGGIYASHIRGEGVELLSSIDEALKIGRMAGLPVHVSHFKSSGRDSWGLVRRAADMIEQARKSGQPVTADQYPYVASSTSLEATLIPTWARAGGQQELLARLDDPQVSARLLPEIQRALDKRDGGETIQIAHYAPHPEWAGRRLSQIATAQKIAPLELALEITRNGGAGIVNFNMDEADVRHVMQRPWVATATDGRAYLPGSDKPHPRSYGTFSRKLGYYAIREEVLPLTQAIRSSSGLPAEILGLADRGLIRAGMAADVVVFDPKAFIDRATYADPHQYSTGTKYVFVNGSPAVFDGQPTGALAGKALRHKSVANAKRSEDGE